MALTRKEITKRYYERHKQECLRRTLEWKRRTKAYASDLTKQARKKWYAANRDKILTRRRPSSRAAAKRYRAAHPELKRQQSRDYMRSVSKTMKEKWATTYRQKNRTRLNAKAREAYKQQPARRVACKIQATLRKVLVRGASRITGPIDRLSIYARDKGVCHLCGLRTDIKDFHVDHIKPLSKGGEHSRENVAVSHPVCNRKKGSKVLSPSGYRPEGLKENQEIGELVCQ